MKYTDKKIRKTSYDKLFNLNSKLVALDMNLKNSKNIASFNEQIFNAGGRWFEEGFELEEADDKFLTDENFIRGYRHMERVYDINDTLYREGSNCYLSGKDLSFVPEEMGSNKYFLEGYNDAKSLDSKRKR